MNKKNVTFDNNLVITFQEIIYYCIIANFFRGEFLSLAKVITEKQRQNSITTLDKAFKNRISRHRIRNDSVISHSANYDTKSAGI